MVHKPFHYAPCIRTSQPSDFIQRNLQFDSNSLSLVMIPPLCHSSEILDLHSHPSITPPSGDDSIAVTGSYNGSSSELFPAPMSSALYQKIIVGDDGVDGGIVASSFPRGGGVPVCKLTTVSVVNADSFAIDGEFWLFSLVFAWC
jgi:hypothetical protein